MNPVRHDLVGLVERAPDWGPPPTYRVLATVRLGTLAQEFEAAAKEGFRLVAFTIGPKESFIVLEKR